MECQAFLIVVFIIYFPEVYTRDFNRRREEIAPALNDFCNRLCKGDSVERNALKEWKLSIFNIVNNRIKFY